MTFIKIKDFCSAKDTIKKIKTQAADWMKIFANHITDRGLISRIHK